MTAALGIDPGISGAVALLGSNGSVCFWNTPFINTGGKRDYDSANMQEILLEALDRTVDAENLPKGTNVEPLGLHLHAYVERAQAMPKQGVTSMFNYGKGFGLWLGLLVGIGIPYTLVTPQRWKKIMLSDMAKDKGASMLRAKQLFPQCAAQLQLVKDHNKAEALLIAAYGQQL
ncbi:hypothetical protein LCGC14_1863010 [marine sediment metagenome]|uniref:Uncharacterized protein n=1 Tax=marine sediment metagenome TaxID=412755 RepID=A0A0F9G6Y3_9ZZZZ